ncbi:MAG: ATP-binding protein [Pseudomonadota bacterium]
MVSNHFTLQLGLRVLLIIAAAIAGSWLLVRPGMHVSTVLVLAGLAILAVELWHYVNRTNIELARFLEAFQYGDTTRAPLPVTTGGFEELRDSIAGILQRLKKQRSSQETEARNLRLLIDHSPVPLLTLHEDGALTINNHAARRLFGASQIARISDIAPFGATLRRALSETLPGESRVVTITVDGISRQYSLSVTEYRAADGVHRLLSLQDIQSELADVQVQAWQDLVRVLAHEIMNSMTPITSLANTSTDLARSLRGNAKPDERCLDDLDSALATIAKRSDGLLQFVESYRQLTRLAPPERRRVSIRELIDSVIQLSVAERLQTPDIVDWHVSPQDLHGYLDRELVEPVLLNLLRNAWQATASIAQPRIRINAYLNRAGSLVLEVSDNGPGIAKELQNRVFVPFFTTKKGGSGVGLALAKQVMTAHAGHIRYVDNEGGGARFLLIF